ncbi:uncharacterized protein ANIA_10725 [Aspergillus nidulans FGSC A4]|uniref:Uncharacterized protein n=1 Tax=Emericella nidulans (strain FGSC A4 / ATCC 38163 / CBS 112.46 / NRRL 194 / M139) TaxID=227321 RepID=C8VFI5_EMENI|nr:hypothetical protein [Aspergillus nidulans FGSC A4]CBF81272.1 TPA: hypothetical protein ANIA_10725 [Aspergillus nidulans FGSC A4]
MPCQCQCGVNNTQKMRMSDIETMQSELAISNMKTEGEWYGLLLAMHDA